MTEIKQIGKLYECTVNKISKSFVFYVCKIEHINGYLPILFIYLDKAKLNIKKFAIPKDRLDGPSRIRQFRENYAYTNNTLEINTWIHDALNRILKRTDINVLKDSKDWLLFELV